MVNLCLCVTIFNLDKKENIVAILDKKNITKYGHFCEISFDLASVWLTTVRILKVRVDCIAVHYGFFEHNEVC